jgi:hypothetical protein
MPRSRAFREARRARAWTRVTAVEDLALPARAPRSADVALAQVPASSHEAAARSRGGPLERLLEARDCSCGT